KPLPAPGRLDARAFNIGTSIETSVNTLAKTLQRAASATSPIDYVPARAGELLRSALNTEKARNILQWSPKFSLEDGLTKTFEFFAARQAGQKA
ncbi:MAG: UDP-glucose 4-epimerase, partial [Gemmatimonadaceae bacterium]